MQNTTVLPNASQKAPAPAPVLSVWPPLLFVPPSLEVLDPRVSPVCSCRAHGWDFFLVPKLPPRWIQELERR